MSNMTKRMACAAVLGLLAVPLQDAGAAVTMTDSLLQGSNSRVVTGPMILPASGILKFVLTNASSTVQMVLCVGSLADVNAVICRINLSGVRVSLKGTETMGIIAASELNGKYLFVRRASGNETAQYTLTIE